MIIFNFDVEKQIRKYSQVKKNHFHYFESAVWGKLIGKIVFSYLFLFAIKSFFNFFGVEKLLISFLFQVIYSSLIFFNLICDSLNVFWLLRKISF